MELCFRLKESGPIHMRVLIAEDEVKMAALLKRGLQEEGYAVDVTDTAEDAIWMASETPYDVILLDVMLPDGNGFDICEHLRAASCWAPVLMLTARDAIGDRVRGLDAGADDYLTKPFAFDELLARTRALLRRGAAARPAVLRAGQLTLDPATHAVRMSDVPVSVTAREFTLLEFLMRHPDEVLSRTRIREHVWDFAFDGDSNVVDVYIRYLREKIDRRFGAILIETVRGAGYRMRANVATTTDQD